MPMPKWIILLNFLCITGFLAKTTEDQYHQALRTQFEEVYGLQGGGWVLSDTEQATNTKISLTKTTMEIESAADSLPFAQTINLTVAARGNNSWDNAIRIPSGAEIKSGDVLLLVVWINTVASDEGNVNHVSFKYELTESPWTQSLHLPTKIKEGWRQWMIPFTSKTNYKPDQSRFQLDLGHMAGIIQVGGIAIVNFGDRYDVDDLPFSNHHLDYEGREDNAAWRLDALDRIDRLRKGDLILKVLDKDGVAIPNNDIVVNMKRHEFGFGTAIATRWWYQNTSDATTYLNKLKDLTGDGRTFSIAVFENALKWPAWENTWATTPDQNVHVLTWLKNNGMKVRGHNLVWPKWNHLPNDLEQNKTDLAYLKNRIKTHISEVAGYEGIAGNIDEWDVINEMVHCLDLANVFGTENIYSDWLQWTREVDPNPKLYLNEYSIINGGGNDINSQQKYKDIIRMVLDQGAPLDGIGIQGHMGSSLTPPGKILGILDDFAQFELDLSLTEYDAKGLKGTIQYDYMRDMLITFFSHPQVKNFLMWGFWDGAHWHEDAPIFEKDWTLKPSGQAFLDWVFDTWWTLESGRTNDHGIFKTRAFYGDYEIIVTDGEDRDTLRLSFTESQDTVIIQSESLVTGLNDNQHQLNRLEILGNYPNPFSTKTWITYHLPKASFVNIKIYTITGQIVEHLISEHQAAGLYEVPFISKPLSEGIYFAHIQTENDYGTIKMIIK